MAISHDEKMRRQRERRATPEGRERQREHMRNHNEKRKPKRAANKAWRSGGTTETRRQWNCRTPEARRAERERAKAKRAPEIAAAKALREAARIEREQFKIAEATKAKAEKESARQVRIAEKRQEKPWTNPLLTAAEKWTMQYRLDPEFNIKQKVRASSRRAKVAGPHIGLRMRDAIKNDHESLEVQQLLGYTIADLKEHLQKQFTRGMNWKKFLAAEIHIDHILPLASFGDLTDPEEFKRAWSLSNLRPLWKEQNLAKRAKREHLL